MKRDTEVLTRLNGWQRLWVVTAAVWLSLIVFVGYSDWPHAAQISKAEVYDRLDPENAREISDFYDVLARKYGGGPTGADGIDFTPAPGETVEIDEHVVQFNEGLTEDRLNQASKDYYDVLRDLLLRERATFAGQLVAVWAFPALGLYALGWAIAWVRRGFGGAA